MVDDNRKMWADLNLNLEAHDGLLEVLGGMYQQTFLSQANRPKGMEYLDFVMSEIHGLRIRELLDAKAAGKIVVGTFCLYVPEELVIAANGVCVGLCSGADIGAQYAEEVLPSNTCALIKSFFGFKMAQVCPYLEAADLVIGETTCDGKKKAYELFSDLKETFVIEVPQMKGEAAKQFWRSELVRLMERLQELSGQTITADRLREAIRVVNDKRRALHRLNALRRASPAPISGLDALLINQVAFYDDPVRFTQKINELCDELDQRVAAKEGVAEPKAKRILISGCPMAAPNWKVPQLVESAGAVIVGEESCVGERGTRNLVRDDGPVVDVMLDYIADRYFQIDCACFTPNNERLDHIVEMAKTYQADGVIHYGLQFCTPYLVESQRVKERLEKEGIRLLRIETDYSQEDIPALKTRVEAFLETLNR